MSDIVNKETGARAPYIGAINQKEAITAGTHYIDYGEAPRAPAPRAPKNLKEHAIANPPPVVIGQYDSAKVDSLAASAPKATADTTTVNTQGAEPAYANPLGTISSFVAPLTVDEIENHGIDRPVALGAKIAGDAALTFLPIAKGATAGVRLASPAAYKSAAMTPLRAAVEGESKLSRVGGNVLMSGLDNLAAGAVQAAVDERDHAASEHFINAIAGAAVGVPTGTRSRIKYSTGDEKLYERTLGGGKKMERTYKMDARYLDEDKTRLDQANEIIKDVSSSYRIPLTWKEMGKAFDNAVAFQRNEARRLAKFEKHEAAIEGFQSGIHEKTTFQIPPPTFDDINQYNKWHDKINKFLKDNGLGHASVSPFGKEAMDTPLGRNLRVELNIGKSVPDVEAKLRGRNKPFNPSKTEQDWSEALRQALRTARGGDTKGYSWVELNQPSKSHNEAINKLEQLHNRREIVLQGAGKGGFDNQPRDLTWKEGRPEFMTLDADLNFRSRNAAHMLSNAYERRGEIGEEIIPMIDKTFVSRIRKKAPEIKQKVSEGKQKIPEIKQKALEIVPTELYK